MNVPKVLIVEDDRDLSRLLAEQLRASGYDVSVAGDGAMAIMVAQQQKPYVIVLDIGLPGADGTLVMKRLKSLIPLSGIPVIAITGRPLTEDQEFFLESQAFALLRKPVDLEELQATIRSALGSLSGPDDQATEHRPTV